MIGFMTMEFQVSELVRSAGELSFEFNFTSLEKCGDLRVDSSAEDCFANEWRRLAPLYAKIAAPVHVLLAQFEAKGCSGKSCSRAANWRMRLVS